MSLHYRRALIQRDDHSNNDGITDDDDFEENWQFSEEAAAIKYGVLFGILFLAAIIILGMWFHANQRIKKGLAPLKYHRWLLPRHKRAQFGEPHLAQPQDNFTFYQHTQQPYPGSYGMQPVPPPAYNPNYAQPPVYSGEPAQPPNPAKVDPFRDPMQHAIGEGSNMPTVPPPAAAPPHYG